MRIASGSTDRVIYFVAVDATDLKTRETGLSGFTVYRSRNGGAATAYTTPTVTELSSSNMPGVYALLIDEDTTIGSTHDTEAYVVHITHASMAPVSREIELYRPETTEGNTLLVDSSGLGDADLRQWLGSAPNALVSGRLDASVGAMAANVLTASAIQADAITAAKVAADVSLEVADAVWDEARAGHTTVGTFGEGVANVMGNVEGNVSGNVLGNVEGEVFTIANSGIVAASFAAGAIDASALAASAGTEIAAAVWDKDRASHVAAGSFGQGVASVQGNVTGSVGSVSGNVGGNVSGSVGSIASGGIAAASIAAAAANKIADHVLRRTYANARASSDGDTVSLRSLLGGLAKLVNKWSISGGTLTIYHEDDTTSAGTQTVTTNAAADPITSIDTD